MRLDKPVAGGPCWAAVGTPDLEAGGRFYGELFGWRTETDAREGMDGYTIAYVGRLPVAGMVPLSAEGRPCSWFVTFAVTDLDAAAAN